MIDIHSHIIPYIDDGSESLEKSVEMVKIAISEGVTSIICTPHYRLNNYEKNAKVIKQNFLKLTSAVEKLDIKLFLGQEIATKTAVAEKLISEEVFSLADSKYVLLEFDYNNYVDIESIVFDMNASGYTTIIAHAERYSYLTLKQALVLKQMGALIQINAHSLVDNTYSNYKKAALKLLKNNAVDFIASDYHSNRSLCMKEAYGFVTKKFGKAEADKLFSLNAKKIIE